MAKSNPKRKTRKSAKKKPKHKQPKESLIALLGKQLSLFWNWGRPEPVNWDWIKLGTLILGVGLGFFLLSQEVAEIEKFIPASDECGNYLATKNFAETGKIQAKVLPGTINDKYSDIENRTFIYPLETVLRAPILKLLEGTQVDWRSWSSLAYLWLIILMVFAFVLFKKRVLVPFFYLAFLMVLIGASPWAAKSFHYVRYYPFYLISSLAIHFIATYFYIHIDLSIWKKVAFILLVSTIPFLFHKSGLVITGFWGMVSLFLVLRNYSLKELFSGELLKYSTGFLFIGLVGLYLVINRIQKATNAQNVNIDFNIFPGFVTFSELNMNISSPGIMVLLLLSLIGIWGIKFANSYERGLIALGALSGLLILLSSLFLMAGNTNSYLDYSGYNRYPFIAHGMYLVVLAGLMTIATKALSSFFSKPKRQYAQLGIFLLFCVPFAFGWVNFTTAEDENYHFSIRPQIEKADIENLQKIFDNRGKEVIIIASHSIYHIQFPDNYYYEYSPYDPELDKMEVGETRGGMTKTEDGIATKRGTIKCGTPFSFCRILENHPNADVAFLLFRDFKSKDPLGKLLLENKIKNNTLYTRKELAKKVCN